MHAAPVLLAAAGGLWPESYVAFDFETTGFDRSKDIIWQIGVCTVVNKKIVNETEIILNWQNHPLVNRAWLIDRFKFLAESYEKKGIKVNFSYERLAEGVPPEEGLRFFKEIADIANQDRTWLVGHNIISYDLPFFAAVWHGFNLGPDFTWDADRVADTNRIEKLTQEGERSPALKTQFSWSGLMKTAGSLRSVANLPDHCFNKYRLGEKAGTEVAKHEALYDARLAHILFEEYRDPVEAAADPFGEPAAAYSAAASHVPAAAKAVVISGGTGTRPARKQRSSW